MAAVFIALIELGSMPSRVSPGKTIGFRLASVGLAHTMRVE